jgi:hypothetical protein
VSLESARTLARLAQQWRAAGTPRQVVGAAVPVLAARPRSIAKKPRRRGEPVGRRRSGEADLRRKLAAERLCAELEVSVGWRGCVRAPVAVPA